RGPEAIEVIDDCLRRTAGQIVEPTLVRDLLILRMRHFIAIEDAAGCRTTAEMWEQQNHTDAANLYYSACFRASTASVIQAKDTSEAAKKDAAAEADRAMDWLGKAMAAGFKDAAKAKTEKRLEALRDREDFKRLLSAMETAK